MLRGTVDIFFFAMVRKLGFLEFLVWGSSLNSGCCIGPLQVAANIKLAIMHSPSLGLDTYTSQLFSSLGALGDDEAHQLIPNAEHGLPSQSTTDYEPQSLGRHTTQMRPEAELSPSQEAPPELVESMHYPNDNSVYEPRLRPVIDFYVNRRPSNHETYQLMAGKRPHNEDSQDLDEGDSLTPNDRRALNQIHLVLRALKDDSTEEFQDAFLLIDTFWTKIHEIREKAKAMRWKDDRKIRNLPVRYSQAHTGTQNQTPQGIVRLLQENGCEYSDFLAFDQAVALWLRRIIDHHNNCLLEENEANAKSIANAKLEFFKWLFKEFFFPQKGLPVMGFTTHKVQKTGILDNFEPPQRIMIRSLTSKNEDMASTSQSLVSIFQYYRSVLSESMKKLYNPASLI
ncbi:hypothetical protein O181_011421 [Austropuccinia psidii MF-1]|uniref:Uncharacterized protein n=1 Tax=Austropuccinia psidii MF-1 TaxID=1389203 RepID=A0A9Q3BST0_9BASI|nr:hypothetical protein [Austropuccinia psidii MF-1]